MQRQLWMFLTEGDEEALLARLGEAGPVRVLRGRYFRGSDEALRVAPETLETCELRSGEHLTHVLPASFEAKLAVHEVTSGPFLGWRRLDESRSECLTLARTDADTGGLAPARLATSAHGWFAGERVRKSQDFTRWMGEAMRAVERYWPGTEHDWIRIAPGAEAWARDGGRLHYLFRPVSLVRQAVPPTTPHRRG